MGASFDALFRGCEQRIIVTTFASNVDRIQQIINVAAKYGRKVAVTGRSMENAMKVSTELGYMNMPDGVLVDVAHIKSLPKNKVCIITTGSQGETMSALTRMAFNTHRQVDIQAGDRVIISASAIPGNENSVGSVINELYRKDAEVVNERELPLHVSGHACQEELKIIHALVKPKFFIPVHGEQRHLKTHAKLAREMGMDPQQHPHQRHRQGDRAHPQHRQDQRHRARRAGCSWTATAWATWAAWSCGTGKHLAEDGMIVVVASMSGEDGSVVSGPGHHHPGLCVRQGVRGPDGGAAPGGGGGPGALPGPEHHGTGPPSRAEIKNDLSGFLYKKTKRNPMILPVIMEV